MELITNFAKINETMYNDIRFLSKLTFKTTAYRKNYDFITQDENIITECEGTISVLRLKEKKHPLIIGEYAFSIWNIELANMLKFDLYKLLKKFHSEDTYDELKSIVDSGLFDMMKYKKIVLLHSLVVHADYRKMFVTEEYIESIYRDYYDDGVAILALVKPYQNNGNDKEYYEEKLLKLLSAVKDTNNFENITASDYYSLKDFETKDDTEINEYKLFSVATRCGFNRIGDTHIFKFSPTKTVNRLLSKYEIPRIEN
jgi:hypothetical protein